MIYNIISLKLVLEITRLSKAGNEENKGGVEDTLFEVCASQRLHFTPLHTTDKNSPCGPKFFQNLIKSAVSILQADP